MGKILFWFILILAVLIGARLLTSSVSKNPPTAPPGKRGKPKHIDMGEAESMTRCEHCGIHLPRSEAFLSQGKTWCGPEHARLGQRTPR